MPSLALHSSPNPSSPCSLNSQCPYSIYVSSGLGSLGVAEDPSILGHNLNWFAYRMSKAALNMWAIQQARIPGKKGVKTFVMDPGFIVSNLRGKSEEARHGGAIGNAQDPRIAGQLMLNIIQGRRDEHVGKFVHVGGVLDSRLGASISQWGRKSHL